MSFATIENQFLQLRGRMTVALGRDYIGEITVTKPDGENSELSFLRLVIWCYVLQNENGRVVLRFVDKIPSVSGKAILKQVGALRTWLAHNLSFDKVRDLKTLQAAEAWLIKACGTGSPRTLEEWGACSRCLQGEISGALDEVIKACDFFATQEDGARLVGQLKHQAERNWDAYKFDIVAESACNNFGYKGLDIQKFREKNLAEWRKVVDMALDENMADLLKLRIEADLITLMNFALPVPSDDIKSALEGVRPEALAIAISVLRARICGAIESPAIYLNAVLAVLKGAATPEAAHQKIL
jgi:hypothetical protein